MRATAQPVDGNKVKLSVELDEAELDEALDEAYRRLGREVKVPGFRPGKVPRRLLEARMGAGAVRREVVREALPDYYARAVRDTDVDAIAAPEIEITAGEESGSLAFDAVVEVRPKVAIPGYQGLRVTVPSMAVTDDEVKGQIDRLREQSGELAEVSRPARDADHLTIDVKGHRHEKVLEALSADDYLYEVGSASLMPGLDDQLRGARPGEIFRFNSSLPGQEQEEATFQVLVKAVKEKVLPEVSDEWAAEASEFETVEELVADTRRRLGAVKRFQAQLGVREEAVRALVQLVTEEPPESLVEAALEHRAHELAHHVESQGITMDDYLQALGQDKDTALAELRATAVESVKADLALRALADAEGIEVDEADVDAELEKMSQRLRQPTDRLLKRLEGTDEMYELRSGVRRAKAVAWLMDHVEIVDEEGRAVDRSDFTTTDAATDSAETPAAESPAAESPSAESPAAESPAAESPSAESPAAESPAAESPSAESPSAESPSAESPSAGAPDSAAAAGAEPARASSVESPA